ncbi:hypothetical protein SKAU_G00269740 [Synaphobranchus kaupii]|uniref:Uncharacterized protein n=1 Tax=Synaphobranchus kaupii TaxID=118154 RepID=A0A9Q1F010_SYNKA|nr:hypothetical protein SKAU_G00269740 [Synaphobranchus kaupii]
MQSNSPEAGHSQRMEKAGFEKSLDVLEKGYNVDIKAIVTDRYTGVQLYMWKERLLIQHYFVPWHLGKGIGKKMDALAKNKSTQEVGARVW